MARLKRILWKTAVSIIVIVLLLWGAYGLLNNYWSRQIEDRLAAIRAAGEPVLLGDTHDHPVPARENGAPIYDRAFAAMSAPAAQRDMQAVYPILSPSGAPSPADWTNAKDALKRCDQIVKLLQEAQSKPRCQFPPYPVVTGTSTKAFSRQQAAASKWDDAEAGLRSAARLLSAKAIVSAQEGNTGDAVRYTESALKVSDATRKDTMLLDYLVRASIICITLNNMRQTLTYCQPGEPQLRQLDDDLSRIDAAKLYRIAIEGERAHVLTQQYESRKAGITSMTPYVYNGDTLAYLDFTARHLKSTRMNYSDALSKGLLGPHAGDSIPFYAIITKILAPVTARAANVRYRCEAEIDCARAFLALRAYKGRFKRYPQTLSELTSRIAWKLPADPFTGSDLAYRRVGDGFVVYSLGYDLKDNGGKPIKARSLAGDIVWSAAQ